MSKKTIGGLTREQMRAYRDYRHEGKKVEKAIELAKQHPPFRTPWFSERARWSRAYRREQARWEAKRPAPPTEEEKARDRVAEARAGKSTLTEQLNTIFASTGMGYFNRVMMHDHLAPNPAFRMILTTRRFRRLKRNLRLGRMNRWN